MKANAVTSGKRERMPQTNYCTVTEGACCSSNPPSSSHSLQTRRIYTAAHPQSEHVHHNHTCSFFLFLFLLLYFFARTCFPFVQTQKQAYTLLVFFISLLQSGWIHGVHAQPLPHHASPSLGVRGTGKGARECGGSTGLLEEGGVVVGKGVGGWHTSAGRERERERWAQRLGENEKGVARVSGKWHTQGGCAGEVGWNKCYRGARDCVFPMVHYSLFFPLPPSEVSHPNPQKPAAPTPLPLPPRALSICLALFLDALSRKERGRLSFTPQGRRVFNEFIQMKKFNTMDGLPQPK